ncbi:hypothetical protein Dimus_029939 [Dionaea muscipula]
MSSRRRRRLIKKKGLVPSTTLATTSCIGRRRGRGGFYGCEQTQLHIHPVAAAASALEAVPEIEGAEEEEEVFVVGREAANELVELEKEMWDRFYSAGFWRSPSQRESTAAAPPP